MPCIFKIYFFYWLDAFQVLAQDRTWSGLVQGSAVLCASSKSGR